MQATCPHCRNAMDLADGGADELLCPSCGSSFRRDPMATATWSAKPAKQQMGRFELLEEVGRGGFGTVYRALDPELDRCVAIKVLRDARLASAGDVDRFLREARLAAQLRHPAIVPIHEVGQHDGTPYLVSEFVEGTTLSEFMTARRPTPTLAAELTAAIADALQYAHERGVVHRDVKPSNIMMERVSGGSASGGAISGSAASGGAISGGATSGGASDHAPSSAQYAPRLMDFGLARRETGEVTVTTDGEVLGTPAYMSPEQARGESHLVDGRSDVYSLGVILYQMLTGELPFRGAPRMLLHQVLNDDPRLLRSLNDRIPRDLETICLKAMAKEPARRYATAALFADDLRRFLRGDAILARPVGRGEKLWRWCRRNPALAVATGLTVAALWAVAIVSAVFAVREGRHAHDLGAALKISEEHRLQADYRLAESYLDRGLTLCEQGELARGMLWFARGLEVAPETAADLQHVLRSNLADWSIRLTPLRGVFRYPGSSVLQLVGPDARTILVVNTEGQAELWDAATNQRITELGRQRETLASFSSDGRTVVIADAGDGAGKVWDTVTGRPLGTPLPPHGKIRSVALSVGGKHVLTVSADQTVRVWDAMTSKPSAMLRPHAKEVSTAAFSPNGKTILTTADKEARLWDAATGQAIGEMLQHAQTISATAFSRDGRFLVTGGWDRSAQVWSTDTGQPVGDRLKHPKPVIAVALSPDGNTAFVGGDAKGRLWDVVSGKPIGPPLAHRNRVQAAVFSTDGKTLLTGSMDGTARLWDAATGAPHGPALPHNQTVSNVVFGLQGANFATETREGEVRLWEMRDERPSVVPLTVKGELHAMSFRADADVVVTASGQPGSGEARLWDVATGKPRSEPLHHPHSVRAVALNADGSVLATGTDDGFVRVWDAVKGEILGPAMRHSGSVRGVAFEPGGKALVSVSSSETAQRWDPLTRQAIGDSWRHKGQVLAVAVSPDGKFILTGGSESAARLWTTAGKPVGNPLRHQDWVIAVAVSPDSKLVLTGSDDMTARLWDVTTGKPIRLPMVHRDAVAAATFSRDGNTLATGSEDKTARRWDVVTGRPIGPPLEHSDWVIALAFQPDGRTLITGCVDKTIRAWKLPAPASRSPEQVVPWVQTMTGQELDTAGAIHLLDAAEWHKRRQRLR